MRYQYAGSTKPLEFKGYFYIKGQKSDEQLPESIKNIFDKNKDVETIAINRKNSGSIYSRIEG